MSNAIGLAFHLYEMGAINKEDTGGLALEWGNADVVEPLIDLTLERKGIGELLSQGSHLFGKHFGYEEEAVQVNGLEVPHHDPRGASGMALVYATSPRGACHNQSDYFFVDVGQVEPTLGMDFFSPHDGAKKAINVKKHQDWRTIFNSLVMCLFANLEPQNVLDLIRLTSGVDWSVNDMLLAGERVWNLKRSINNRLGLGRSNDRLPKTFLQAFQDDEEGESFIPDFEAMLESYNEARDWNMESGFPNPNKLAVLNLDFAIKDLYSQG